VPFELRKVDLRRAVTLDADHHLSKAKRLWVREGSQPHPHVAVTSFVKWTELPSQVTFGEGRRTSCTDCGRSTTPCSSCGMGPSPTCRRSTTIGPRCETFSSASSSSACFLQCGLSLSLSFSDRRGPLDRLGALPEAVPAAVPTAQEGGDGPHRAQADSSRRIHRGATPHARLHRTLWPERTLHGTSPPPHTFTHRIAQ